MAVIRYWLRPVILLSVMCALPIFVIRAQPYDDPVTNALVHEKCAPPCFMGILPGWTTMREAFYLVAGHDWVANTAEQFPSVVRASVYFDAPISRTIINWRWSAALPEWIDGEERGNLLVQDTDVLAVNISTYLSPGDIVLAFGKPDEVRFLVSDSQPGKRFEYVGWYADRKMLIRAEGYCPIWHYHSLPTHIAFRLNPPNLAEAFPKTAVCKG